MLRQFASAWLVFFLAWAAVLWWGRNRPDVGLTLAVLGVVVGVSGWARPSLVRWLFVGAMVLVFPIGWVLSQLLLALLFFGMFFPVALWFRWRGRDVLHRRAEPGRPSYWTIKETPADVRSYFRQY